MCCRKGNDDTDCDVVIGGVANDKVFNTVELFFDGLIDKTEAIRRLRYEKPNLQSCFRFRKALEDFTLRGAKLYEGKSNFITKKYADVISCFARKENISLDQAMDIFYRSEVYRLIREGVSDMHCMSREYLAEELDAEYRDKK